MNAQSKIVALIRKHSGRKTTVVLRRFRARTYRLVLAHLEGGPEKRRGDEGTLTRHDSVSARGNRGHIVYRHAVLLHCNGLCGPM